MLRIGDNVGISQAALVAIADITIGNNVKIGGEQVSLPLISMHWIPKYEHLPKIFYIENVLPL